VLGQVRPGFVRIILVKFGYFRLGQLSSSFDSLCQVKSG